MNAIIKEEYEAPVLTNEGIEIHLTYLRTGFDAMQAALPVLRDKIDARSEKADARFEALSAKIDDANKQRAAGDAALGEKIEKVNANLSEKIENLTKIVIGVEAHQRAALWVISLGTLAGVSVSIARTLGWI